MKNMFYRLMERKRYDYLDIEFIINIFAVLILMPTMLALALFVQSYLLCVVSAIIPNGFPYLVLTYLMPDYKQKFPFIPRKLK